MVGGESSFHLRRPTSIYQWTTASLSKGPIRTLTRPTSVALPLVAIGLVPIDLCAVYGNVWFDYTFLDILLVASRNRRSKAGQEVMSIKTHGICKAVVTYAISGCVEPSKKTVMSRPIR